jgi:tRNA-specific 2-thiouridylase
VEDSGGRRLGTHAGAAAFTVGQRRGLGVAATEPLYVTHVDVPGNRLTVGPRAEASRRSVDVSELNWVDVEGPVGGEERRFEVEARIRHGQPPAAATLVSIPGGRARVEFREPVFAPAPGQALVAYRGDAVLCGGTIESSAA